MTSDVHSGSIVALIDAWMERTTTEGTFSPGPVQDLMFEIWPETAEESPARDLVQRWLTLTVQRNLIGAEELHEALTEIRASFLVPAKS